MPQEILPRLQEIFRITFQLPELIITAETSPSHIAVWSSLNHVRLIAAIEKEFNRKFSLDDLMSISTVSDLVQILQR